MIDYIGAGEFRSIEIILRSIFEDLLTPKERAARSHFMKLAEDRWWTLSLSDRERWFNNVSLAQRALKELHFKRDSRFYVVLDELFRGPPTRWSGQIATAGDLMAEAHEFMRNAMAIGVDDTDDPRAVPILQERMNDLEVSIGLYKYRWACDGFPLIKISPKYAAAAMCTSLSPDIIADLRGPWRAFDIEMPEEDVLYQENSDRERMKVSHLQVYYGKDQPNPWCLALRSGLHTEYNHRTWMKSSELCSSDRVGDQYTLPWFSHLDFDNRALMLAGRIVANVICSLTETRHVREISQREHQKPREHSPATAKKGKKLMAQIYQITEPVTVDLVQAVRNYQLRTPTKKAWKLAVQTVVCGHRKMQTCGPGRQDRKQIWVSPYTRGPRNAPMAVRPHVLKDSEDDPTT